MNFTRPGRVRILLYRQRTIQCLMMAEGSVSRFFVLSAEVADILNILYRLSSNGNNVFASGASFPGICIQVLYFLLQIKFVKFFLVGNPEAVVLKGLKYVLCPRCLSWRYAPSPLATCELRELLLKFFFFCCQLGESKS